MVYRSGSITEICTLSDADVISSSATDMSADGSVIIGAESASNIDGSGRTQRSWMFRDNVLSEIVIPGFNELTMLAMSDDASAMIGSAANTVSTVEWFLFTDDGATSAAQLLAGEGVFLAAGESAVLHDISADGTVVFGAIYRDTFSPFGPDWTLFTVRVPTPASFLPLAGIALAVRRRRNHA